MNLFAKTSTAFNERKKLNPEDKKKLLHTSSCPDFVIEEFLNDSDQFVVCEAIKFTTSPSVLRNFATKTKSTFFLCKVLENPNCPLDVIQNIKQSSGLNTAYLADLVLATRT